MKREEEAMIKATKIDIMIEVRTSVFLYTFLFLFPVVSPILLPLEKSSNVSAFSEYRLIAPAFLRILNEKHFLRMFSDRDRRRDDRSERSHRHSDRSDRSDRSRKSDRSDRSDWATTPKFRDEPKTPRGDRAKGEC